MVMMSKNWLFGWDRQVIYTPLLRAHLLVSSMQRQTPVKHDIHDSRSPHIRRIPQVVLITSVPGDEETPHSLGPSASSQGQGGPRTIALVKASRGIPPLRSLDQADKVGDV